MRAPPSNPTSCPQELYEWVLEYLSPKRLGGSGARAHQFTINGLTYPFVRHFNFAAVPDIPEDRRYDMYSGLHLAHPGDLLFFFQADPQDPRGGISARRGIRGIYVVTAPPQRAPDDITDSITGVGYTLLHKCPNPACGSHHSSFSAKCAVCGQLYPESDVYIKGESVRSKVLSSRLPIQPLYAFERTVSDERAYADFSDPGIIWMGRHDNAMGPGKGSSIRHLLPEEAAKLARLLATEPGQSIGNSSKYRPNHGPRLSHSDGDPITDLPVTGRSVNREDELYFLITKQIFDANSKLRAAIESYLPPDIDWDNLEYCSSTFPWGYTSGAADHVVLFRNEKGRRFVLLFECKKDRAHDEAVLQALLYAERVLQVIFLSSPAHFIPDEGIDILPIVIAAGARKVRAPDPRIGLTKPFELKRSYNGGPEIVARVLTPLFLAYKFTGVNSKSRCAMSDFEFHSLPNRDIKEIVWIPESGQVGTAVEMHWILSGSWGLARG